MAKDCDIAVYPHTYASLQIKVGDFDAVLSSFASGFENEPRFILNFVKEDFHVRLTKLSQIVAAASLSRAHISSQLVHCRIKAAIYHTHQRTVEFSSTASQELRIMGSGIRFNVHPWERCRQNDGEASDERVNKEHGLPGRHHMSLIDASALPATFDLPKFLLRGGQLLRLLVGLPLFPTPEDSLLAADYIDTDESSVELK
ncbi:hypothetical protein Goshw_001662, partial [Gossypium schwendimanii]|nr:hypothetical protein [Gossypium schwendimanii]